MSGEGDGAGFGASWCSRWIRVRAGDGVRAKAVGGAGKRAGGGASAGTVGGVEDRGGGGARARAEGGVGDGAGLGARWRGTEQGGEQELKQKVE